MKIAYIIINGNRKEGTSRAVVEVAERLSARHEVTLFSKTADQVDLQRVQWHRIPAFSWPDVVEFESYRLLATRALKGQTFDIIHSAGCNVWNADVYTIQTVHPAKMHAVNKNPQRNKLSLARKLTRVAYDRQVIRSETAAYTVRGQRGIIGYLPVSDGTRMELTTHYPVSGSEIEIIPNAADLDLFHPQTREKLYTPVRSELGLPHKAKVVLFAGGEWRRKGLDLALRGLARLNNDNVYLVVAGTDPHQDLFRTLADELQISRRVRWLGFRDDIERLYAAADIFLFPSYYEAFSLATIEAAAAGIPVIMGDISGAKELLGDGLGGRIVAHDPDAIAQALGRYVNSEPARLEAGLAARLKVETVFNWDTVAAKTENFYERLLARRKAESHPTP